MNKMEMSLDEIIAAGENENHYNDDDEMDGGTQIQRNNCKSNEREYINFGNESGSKSNGNYNYRNKNKQTNRKNTSKYENGKAVESTLRTIIKQRRNNNQHNNNNINTARFATGLRRNFQNQNNANNNTNNNDNTIENNNNKPSNAVPFPLLVLPIPTVHTLPNAVLNMLPQIQNGFSLLPHIQNGFSTSPSISNGLGTGETFANALTTLGGIGHGTTGIATVLGLNQLQQALQQLLMQRQQQQEALQLIHQQQLERMTSNSSNCNSTENLNSIETEMKLEEVLKLLSSGKEVKYLDFIMKMN